MTRFEDVACPMCDEWPPRPRGTTHAQDRFRSHMGKHFQDLARGAIPLAIDGLEVRDDKDDDDDGDPSRLHGARLETDQLSGGSGVFSYNTYDDNDDESPAWVLDIYSRNPATSPPCPSLESQESEPRHAFSSSFPPESDPFRSIGAHVDAPATPSSLGAAAAAATEASDDPGKGGGLVIMFRNIDRSYTLVDEIFVDPSVTTEYNLVSSALIDRLGFRSHMSAPRQRSIRTVAGSVPSLGGLVLEWLMLVTRPVPDERRLGGWFEVFDGQRFPDFDVLFTASPKSLEDEGRSQSAEKGPHQKDIMDLLLGRE